MEILGSAHYRNAVVFRPVYVNTLQVDLQPKVPALHDVLQKTRWAGGASTASV